MAVVAFGFLVALSLGTVELEFQPILLQLFTVVGIGVAVGAFIGFGTMLEDVLQNNQQEG